MGPIKAVLFEPVGCLAEFPAEEFNEIAGCVENRMTYGMDVFHRSVWQNDSAIQFVVRSLADCSLEDFGGHQPIDGAIVQRDGHGPLCELAERHHPIA